MPGLTPPGPLGGPPGRSDPPAFGEAAVSLYNARFRGKKHFECVFRTF